MPTALFLCVHNARRSQMAAGFMRQLSDGAVDVYSGGSKPADAVNPIAAATMAELGIDITGEVPRPGKATEIPSPVPGNRSGLPGRRQVSTALRNTVPGLGQHSISLGVKPLSRQ